MKPIDILVVAQTPPPIHGQSIMTRHFLEGDYDDIRLHHVRMAFSDTIGDVGVFQWKKVLHLVAVILRVMGARLRTGATVLYYPPSGPKRSGFYRDAAVLIATRWMFKRTVFHFYAGGIRELYPQLSGWAQWLYRRAYFYADTGISMHEGGLRDPEFLHARQGVVVPFGIPDEPEAASAANRERDRPPVVTFLAMLSESKGVFIFLEACAALLREGVQIQPVLVGWSESTAFEEALQTKIRELELADILERHRNTTGRDRNAILLRTSVFCFPSFYESEGMPVVLLEAMQFALPVVATQWRGIPETVVEGETGFLVPPRDAAAVADRLQRLLADDPLRTSMSRASRRRYEAHYTVATYRTNMQQAITRTGTGS